MFYLCMVIVWVAGARAAFHFGRKAQRKFTLLAQRMPQYKLDEGLKRQIASALMDLDCWSDDDDDDDARQARLGGGSSKRQKAGRGKGGEADMNASIDSVLSSEDDEDDDDEELLVEGGAGEEGEGGDDVGQNGLKSPKAEQWGRGVEGGSGGVEDPSSNNEGNEEGAAHTAPAAQQAAPKTVMSQKQASKEKGVSSGPSSNSNSNSNEQRLLRLSAPTAVREKVSLERPSQLPETSPRMVEVQAQERERSRSRTRQAVADHAVRILLRMQARRDRIVASTQQQQARRTLSVTQVAAQRIAAIRVGQVLSKGVVHAVERYV